MEYKQEIVRYNIADTMYAAVASITSHLPLINDKLCGYVTLRCITLDLVWLCVSPTLLVEIAK